MQTHGSVGVQSLCESLYVILRRLGLSEEDGGDVDLIPVDLLGDVRVGDALLGLESVEGLYCMDGGSDIIGHIIGQDQTVGR